MTRLGILASGRGSNMRAIIDACNNRSLDASVEIVISNNPDSGALAMASKENIKARYLSSKTHPDFNELDQAMSDVLAEAGVDLVVLAGYMKKIGPKLLQQFKGRIINIHPSLLPKFGGKSMFGLKVHQAVIDAGEPETGVTIHVVDADYDKGMILAQEKVRVNEDDTPQILASRVLKIEHRLYPETINKIIKGQLQLPS